MSSLEHYYTSRAVDGQPYRVMQSEYSQLPPGTEVTLVVEPHSNNEAAVAACNLRLTAASQAPVILSSASLALYAQSADTPCVNVFQGISQVRPGHPGGVVLRLAPIAPTAVQLLREARAEVQNPRHASRGH